MNTFLPENYEVPKAESPYMKFEKGQNKFRVVGSAIVGYIYWTEDNKPVRTKSKPIGIPTNIKKNDDGTPREIKHFWAFPVVVKTSVVNEETGELQEAYVVKILEITQKGIQSEIQDLISNEDWGMPQGYDITITKKGEKLTTEYTVQPSPHKELNEIQKRAVEKTKIDINALYSGKDPFNGVMPEPQLETTNTPTTTEQVTYISEGIPSNYPEAINLEETKF